jgi:hypothetical protein
MTFQGKTAGMAVIGNSSPGTADSGSQKMRNSSQGALRIRLECGSCSVAILHGYGTGDSLLLVWTTRRLLLKNLPRDPEVSETSTSSSTEAPPVSFAACVKVLTLPLLCKVDCGLWLCLATILCAWSSLTVWACRH